MQNQFNHASIDVVLNWDLCDSKKSWPCFTIFHLIKSYICKMCYTLKITYPVVTRSSILFVSLIYLMRIHQVNDLQHYEYANLAYF